MQLAPVQRTRDRPVALFILLALLSVFEPVLVLLAVGHGGPFEGLSLLIQLLLSKAFGITQVGIDQEGTTQVGVAQVSTAKDGIAQVGIAQDGIAQDGIAQDG